MHGIACHREERSVEAISILAALRQELLERAGKGQLPGATPEVIQRLEAQAGKR